MGAGSSVTAEVITVLALIAGISWLGIMVVSAFRNRGGEEIAPNLRPGIDDQQLETRRLETGQKAAIAFSAFLAVSLPLYFLGEPARQEGFVTEFDQASIDRGATIAGPAPTGFDCFSCHGPLGSGGVANYVERRSGVRVEWVAPPLDDIFFRYSEDEVTYWITFGRANTPMPAWGLAGGGPMSEHQVQDVVNYLQTIQRTQQEVVEATGNRVQTELDRLTAADVAVSATVVRQEQVVAEIDQAAEDYEFVRHLAEEARMLLNTAGEGRDTDADGVSDATEVRLSEISVEVFNYFRAFEPVRLDPATPDAELVGQAIAQLEAASQRDPILRNYIALIEAASIDDEGDDTDGDGITDSAESRINAFLTEAAATTVPANFSVVTLDPQSAESVQSTSDMTTATRLVGAIESISITKRVLTENEDRIRPTEEAGLAFLRQAVIDRKWEIDIPGVARAMGVSEEEAARAVGLFNANCARCHTSGFSAGMAFTQEVGSGGFAPALWEGRPEVQFGLAPTDDTLPDTLFDFILNGSVADAPYGYNGMGTGRMPGFGFILPSSDIDLLARYLRSGNLKGVE